MPPETVLARLRKICLALPAATEKLTWGHPTFQTGGKTFAVYEQYKGEWSIVVKVGREHQALFLADARFYKTPYIGDKGWVSLRVAGKLDWREIRELAAASHRLVNAAAKKR